MTIRVTTSLCVLLTLSGLAADHAIAQNAPVSSSPLTTDQAKYLLRRPAGSSREFYDERARVLALRVLTEADDVSPHEFVDLAEVAIRNRNIVCRHKILQLACQRADDEGALRIVELMREFGGEYFRSQSVGDPAKYADSKVLDHILMIEFLRVYSKVLATHMSDPGDLAQMFLDWLVVNEQSQRQPELGVEVCHAIAQLPAAVELRREWALRVLETCKRGTQPPDEIFNLVDEQMLPALRDLVEQSRNHPERFPVNVARYLADRGDLEILPTLKEVERLSFPAELRQGREPEELPCTLSWRIRAQNPKEDMLIWLAKGPSESVTERIGQAERVWLIRRAVAMGLARQEIRQAAIQYATSYLNAGHPWRMELPEFKAVAISLGVLAVDDLPEIVIRQSRSEEQSASASQPETPVSAPNADVDPWKYWHPNEANYEVLAEWMTTVDWNTVPEDQGFNLMIDKMCELDLIRPDKCPEPTTTQP